MGNIRVIIPIIVANQIVSNLIRIPLVVDISRGIFDKDNNPTIENSVAPKPPGKKDSAPKVIDDKWANKESFQDILYWPIVFIIKFKEYPSINHGQIPIKIQITFNLKFTKLLNKLRNSRVDFFEMGKYLNKIRDI